MLEPTATRTFSGAPESSASPTASPTVTSPVVATCADISTVGFQAHAAVYGWVSVEQQDRPNGGNPFDRFPGGSPDDAVSCSWAPTGGGTDNATFFAWTQIGAGAAADAEQVLVDEGGNREDTPVGVYISFPGQGGGESTYLFTSSDVRWANSPNELGYVKAPDENG